MCRMHQIWKRAVFVGSVFALCGLAACSEDLPVSTSNCELTRPVVFAGLDWESNAFHTEVARIIIEKGFDCRTEIIPGTTIPLIAGLRRGDVDIMMEVWRDNITKAWDEGVARGEVADIGINFPDAVQGFYVPRYMIEGDPARGLEPSAPDLKSIYDLPKYRSLMADPEEPGKGRFYNCILGWACEQINTKKLEAYGVWDTFTNFRTGTGAALANAIASNYKRGKPFVAYYWGPTWILGQYDLVMLEEPPYNEKDWLAMSLRDDYSHPVAYPLVPVVIGVNAQFKTQAPQLIGFLSKYRTSNALVSEALASLRSGPDRRMHDVALDFLRDRPEIWRAWLVPEIADKVAASIAPPESDEGNAL